MEAAFVEFRMAKGWLKSCQVDTLAFIFSFFTSLVYLTANATLNVDRKDTDGF